MMGFGLIWMLLFWGGLIALSIWLISLLFPTTKELTNSDSKQLSTEEVLKIRYAQGELTTKEYHKILKTIQNN